MQPVESQVSQPRNWSEHLMQTSSKFVSSKILTIFSCNWPQDIVPLFLIHRKESSGHSWKKTFFEETSMLKRFFEHMKKICPFRMVWYKGFYHLRKPKYHLFLQYLFKSPFNTDQVTKLQLTPVNNSDFSYLESWAFFYLSEAAARMWVFALDAFYHKSRTMIASSNTKKVSTAGASLFWLKIMSFYTMKWVINSHVDR